MDKQSAVDTAKRVLSSLKDLVSTSTNDRVIAVGRLCLKIADACKYISIDNYSVMLCSAWCLDDVNCFIHLVKYYISGQN